MKGTEAVVVLHPTARFSVLGSANEKVLVTSASRDDEATTQQHAPRTKKKSIFLDINDPYTRRLIQKAFSHPSRACNFRIVLGPGHGMDAVPLPPDCDFQWSEYERIDWSAVLKGQHGASSYCIRKGLSRKAQLAHYTHRHVVKHPDSILKTCMPETVVLDTWPVWEHDLGRASSGEGLADIVVANSGGDSTNMNRRARLDQCLHGAQVAMHRAEQAFANDETSIAPVWIFKGSTVNKGAGIYIVHLYEQVVDICWSESDIREWVLQRYIASPLLLNRRKFHIRAYAVAVSALRVYLSHDCLALCAGTRYRQNDTGNLFAHITNTAYQDLDPNFCEDKCVLLWDEHDIAPVLVQDGTCANLAEASRRIQKVIEDIEAIVAELFCAYQNEFGVFSPLDGCFEHYGLDFVVDDRWQVYLLEVNPGPDFKQTGTRLEGAIENLMASTIDVALTDTPPRPHPRPSKIGNLKLVYETQSNGQGKGISMKVLS